MSHTERPAPRPARYPVPDTRFLLLPLLLLAVAPVGCSWMDGFKKKDPADTTGKTAQRVPPRQAGDFVAYLNRQAGYLQTVRYDSVSVKASAPDMWAPRLNEGWMVCSKPNNFRMQSGLLVGGAQLDVGSNRDEMWMYVKQSPTPYLFCSHTDFPKVQDSLPVKFEPEWVLQALGMTSFDPNRKYELEASDKTAAYYLKYEDVTATGERVMKVTEFAADAAADGSPRVRKHAVLQSTDGGREWKPIAVAEVKRVTTHTVTDPKTGQAAAVQVPSEVTLEWPQQKVKMDLTLRKVEVNPALSQEQLRSLFDRPAKINNAAPVNMADYRTPLASTERPSQPRGSMPDVPRFK